MMVQAEKLQKYALFGGLTTEQIENVMTHLKLDNFSEDEIIIKEGDLNDRIYFLLEGQVAVLKGETLLAKFGIGENFGEIEVLDVMPAVASIKTLTKVTVLSMSNKELRAIYKMDVSIFSLIVMNLARDLSRRLRRMDENLASAERTILL